MTYFRLVCAFCLALAVPFVLGAQQPDTKNGTAAKKSFTLRGVVEGVDAKAGRLTVNHEKVEGWMDAMTMAYGVDKPDQLEKLKSGDRIEATVYEGEYKLYDIKVTGHK